MPALPGCISEGDTLDDAIANIKEAIDLYLEPIEDEVFDYPNASIREVEV